MFSSRFGAYGFLHVVCLVLLGGVHALPSGPAFAEPSLAIVEVSSSSDAICSQKFLGWYRQQPGVARTGPARISSDMAWYWDAARTIARFVCVDDRPPELQALSADNAPIRGYYRMRCITGYYMRIMRTLHSVPKYKVDCAMLIEEAREILLNPGTTNCEDISIGTAPADWLSLQLSVDIDDSTSGHNNGQEHRVASDVRLTLLGSENIPLEQESNVVSAVWDLPVTRIGTTYRACAHNPAGQPKLGFFVALTGKHKL